MGFYCMMHGYQKPRQQGDGTLDTAPPFEMHLRRRTSFIAPESNVAGEMMKSPGLLRDRPGLPKSAAGAQIVSWLMERKGLDEAGALAMATRMVTLEILQPLQGAPAKGFGAEKTALYKVVLMGQAKPPTS
jgi:hypothetical protein